MEGPLDAEALAQELRSALPDADPFDLHPDELTRVIADAGGDPGDDALVAAVLVAWEALIS